MRGGNRQGAGTSEPSRSSFSPEPSDEGSPVQAAVPATQPVYQQTAQPAAPAESRAPIGARRWEAPPPVEREEPRPPAESGPKDAPVGDLVKQLTEQIKTLVRQEMRLAQVELQEKGKKVGMGAGLFGAGGLVGFFGAATMIVALVLAIDTALPAWLAALIVGVVLLAGAGIAALLGKKQIEKATPPAPEEAIESVKQDVATVKERARV